MNYSTNCSLANNTTGDFSDKGSCVCQEQELLRKGKRCTLVLMGSACTRIRMFVVLLSNVFSCSDGCVHYIGWVGGGFTSPGNRCLPFVPEHVEGEGGTPSGDRTRTQARRRESSFLVVV